MDSREWVVLKKTEQGYRQLGPFDARSVNERIQAGEVTYSDHVWKAGFGAWKRLGDLHEFGAPLEHSAPEAFPDSIDVDLEDVVQQVRLPPDFSLLPPRAPEVSLDMVKGLPITGEDGRPVDFLEHPLRASRKLHYRIRVPKSPRERAIATAASAALILIFWFGKPYVTSLDTAEPVAETSPIAEPIVAPVAAPTESLTELPPIESSAGPTSEVPTLAGEFRGTDDLRDGVSAIALKEALLEEAYKSLRSDETAWNLYFADWVRGLDVDPLKSMGERDYARVFKAETQSKAAELQELYQQLLQRSETLNHGSGAGPSDLKSKIKIFGESLEN
ncbi:MAG: DUF4339 domain-containing protein [Bdellovibrionia bacterium]